MPRDSNQVYTLPEAPFQTNTVAQPGAVNNNFSDIAAALTTSLTRAETTAFSRSLLDDPDASTARTTLGATTTGSALMTAADAAAARTTLGATVTGAALLTAADAAAARTTLGATATGTALLTAADAAAARTTLGGTTPGIQVFTAPTDADARFAISAPANPTGISSLIGEWRTLSAGAGIDLTLPANGVWAAFASVYDTSNVFSGVTVAAVAAGGTVISAGLTGFYHTGFCWRIS